LEELLEHLARGLLPFLLPKGLVTIEDLARPVHEPVLLEKPHERLSRRLVLVDYR
jgi:hypothetical protein